MYVLVLLEIYFLVVNSTLDKSHLNFDNNCTCLYRLISIATFTKIFTNVRYKGFSHFRTKFCNRIGSMIFFNKNIILEMTVYLYPKSVPGIIIN